MTTTSLVAPQDSTPTSLVAPEDSTPTTSRPDPEPATTTSTTVRLFTTGDVDGFDSREITLDGEEWTVAVADTPELRQRGLMFVEDLGDLQGMVFVFEQERSGGFWMKNTLIALDIAFFDAAGTYVGGLTMEPCDVAPCPTYDVGRSYGFALEAPSVNL